MRILLLTQIVPFPPDSGPKIKTYHVLRYLAQRHRVHLVSFVRSAEEESAARSLAPLCEGVTTVPLRRSPWLDVAHLARSLVNGRPFLVARDESRAMREAIGRVISERPFDAVHADQLSMAQYAVDLPLRLRVLDEHNAVWTIVRRAAAREGWGARRLAAEIEWRKLRAYEGRVCRRFDRVTVVSHQDRRDLAEAAGSPLAAPVIPIAVDPDRTPTLVRDRESRRITSVATMFYPPNVEGVHWFASQVLPLVRAELPEATFYVVGSRPPERIRELARAGGGVVVTGYVAELEPVLAASALLVVPLHSGSGMRVKILEAFARALPVVSTTVGVEGIDAVAGEHLLVADSADGFAAAVTRLLRDPAEGDRLAAAGRRLVEERYHWRTALRGLDDIYVEAAAPTAAV